MSITRLEIHRPRPDPPSQMRQNMNSMLINTIQDENLLAAARCDWTGWTRQTPHSGPSKLSRSPSQWPPLGRNPREPSPPANRSSMMECIYQLTATLPLFVSFFFVSTQLILMCTLPPGGVNFICKHHSERFTKIGMRLNDITALVMRFRITWSILHMSKNKDGVDWIDWFSLAAVMCKRNIDDEFDLSRLLKLI